MERVGLPTWEDTMPLATVRTYDTKIDLKKRITLINSKKVSEPVDLKEVEL